MWDFGPSVGIELTPRSDTTKAIHGDFVDTQHKPLVINGLLMTPM
jgi:hypothetical protein